MISQMADEAKNEREHSLIQRARDGDLSAYRHFVERYSPRVHSIAYQMCGNSEDARDITQDVFIRLYKSLDKFRSDYVFSTWLYRLTINVSIDFYRKTARHRHVALEEVQDESALQDSNPRPDMIAEQNEFRGVVGQLTKYLTRNQRKVFILRDLQSFSSEEVARILKCSPSTVRVHLASARCKIRQALIDYDPSLVRREKA